MRVLVLTQHYAPEENAPALRWSWLAEAFGAHGLHVDVITATWADELRGVQTDARVTVHRVRSLVHGKRIVRRLLNETIFDLKAMWVAVRLARPDVVVVSVPPLGSVPLAGALRLVLRRPLVLEMRDTWPELLEQWKEWSDGGEGRRAYGYGEVVVGAVLRVLRRYLLRIQRRAALVVTTTDDYAAAISARVDGEVLCVRNAFPSAARSNGSPRGDRLRVLYLGNVGRSQHLATAVRAAARVHERGGLMVLRIVGDGAHLSHVKALARRLEAPVEFVARTQRAHVADHYEWADTVLVLLRDWPSMRQTVPSKLYEAIQTGRHVSASLAGEAARIVSESAAGDVVPPKDSDALADLWMSLIAEPSRLRGSSDLQWLRKNVDQGRLATEYVRALHRVVREAAAA
ncbi:glycosyltransferase family 4 protein [Epidermidibacterium keratini]